MVVPLKKPHADESSLHDPARLRVLSNESKSTTVDSRFVSKKMKHPSTFLQVTCFLLLSTLATVAGDQCW
jgi:hypothetical protein